MNLIPKRPNRDVQEILSEARSLLARQQQNAETPPQELEGEDAAPLLINPLLLAA